RPAYPDERRLQFVDNFSVIRGSHSFKFGGEINRAYDILNNPALFNGAFTYSGPYALGLDILNPTGANHYTRFQQKFGLPGTEFGTIDFAGYAQDQWKIRRNITINYGIRYDYEKLPSPQYPNPAIPETLKLNSDT
ncbi:MAG: TonB-dependent receptor plug, partial [Bryobacterales bacterium]|nr:TonB-dependent receptor plug [Bryobacterales bacterium]